MAADTTALGIASRLWPGVAVALEELPGGLTNLNYKVTTPAGSYVIRLFAQGAELLAIDRDVELAAASLAARLGIGPDVVACAPREGYLVTRFLPGRQPSAEQMRAPAMMARITAALRVLHHGGPIPGILDPFTVVDFYRDNAVARGVDPGTDYSWARPVASRVKRAVAFGLTAPCHGDLLTANFIDQAGHMYFVDWEYAGMSDPRFDLANFSVNHDFGVREDRELVRLYYGDEDEHAFAALRTLRFVSAFREAMWSVLQQAISDLPFDFAERAREQFAAMHAAAAGDEFQAALEFLESAGSGPRGGR
jgi:aminoglycoside phosphotransferase (APT) family kinase protein